MSDADKNAGLLPGAPTSFPRERPPVELSRDDIEAIIARQNSGTFSPLTKESVERILKQIEYGGGPESR